MYLLLVCLLCHQNWPSLEISNEMKTCFQIGLRKHKHRVAQTSYSHVIDSLYILFSHGNILTQNDKYPLTLEGRNHHI